MKRTYQCPNCGHVLNSVITKRERQIIALVRSGMTNKLIAHELGIAEGTVKVYLTVLYRKLNVHNRTGLAVWAEEHKAHAA